MRVRSKKNEIIWKSIESSPSNRACIKVEVVFYKRIIRIHEAKCKRINNQIRLNFTIFSFPERISSGRGVNNSFEGRTVFGIFRDFQGFLGIFWDFFLKSVRDFFSYLVIQLFSYSVIYPSSTFTNSWVGGESEESVTYLKMLNIFYL